MSERLIAPGRKVLRYPDVLAQMKRGDMVWPLHVEMDLSNRCNLRCAWCLTEAAEVHILGVGERSIAEVLQGDHILAWNEATGSVVWSEVKLVSYRRIKELIYRVAVAHSVVEATGNHEFWTDQGWKPARELRSGDAIGVIATPVRLRVWPTRDMEQGHLQTGAQQRNGPRRLETQGSESVCLRLRGPGEDAWPCVYCKGHYNQDQRFRQHLSEQMKAHNPMWEPATVAKAVASRPPDMSQRISVAVKASFARGERHPQVISAAGQQRIRDRMTQHNPMHDPAVVARVHVTLRESGYQAASDRLKACWQNPEYRQAQSDRMKQHNPILIPAVRDASTKRLRLMAKPSKVETWFTELCQDAGLPIWYTGAGQFWVSHHNPDYKVHNRQMVIELTDGWRTKPSEKRNPENYGVPMLDYYSQHGYACLVLFVPPHPRQREKANGAALGAVREFVTTGQSAICDTAESTQ